MLSTQAAQRLSKKEEGKPPREWSKALLSIASGKTGLGKTNRFFEIHDRAEMSALRLYVSTLSQSRAKTEHFAAWLTQMRCAT